MRVLKVEGLRLRRNALLGLRRERSFHRSRLGLGIGDARYDLGFERRQLGSRGSRSRGGR